MPVEVVTFAGSRSGPQFGRRDPRRKPVSILNGAQPNLDMLGSFKSRPSYMPADFKSRRPFMGQCCRCVPISRDEFPGALHADLSMRNILDVRKQFKSKSIWLTFFSKVIYSMHRPLFRPFPHLSMAVLTNPHVAEAIRKAAKELDNKYDFKEKSDILEKRAATIVTKMMASVSTVFIRFTGWFLLKFLSCMHRAVLVQPAQMAVLKKASEKGIPMIYLPLHRSHLDYILITFTLWNYDIRAPHVAAGDNMDIPFFGFLMKSLGGFFIRRRLDNGHDQKDIVYRAILHTYMMELLKKGESLEFFIEGGRTRTGRAVIPKGGLLSVVTEACIERIIHDVYIVPVTFSYDKLLDGNFCKEQMGQSKQKESFVGACKAILRILFGDYGSVRVDYAQPFSLREFIRSAEYFPPPALKRSLSLSYGSVSGLNLSHQALSMASNGVVPDSRALVKSLAEHTVYTSVHTQASMSTHCLAFLLLTKYRQGCSVSCLAQDMDWLKEQLYNRKLDTGFSGPAIDCVLHAQRLLGDNIVKKSGTCEDKEMVFIPSLSLPEVFVLSYNANTLTSAFVLESIVACAVVAESGLMPNMLTSQQFTGDMPKVVRENVLATAQRFTELLHAEFVLVPPCRSVMELLAEQLEGFIHLEILQVEEREHDEILNTSRGRWANHMARSLDFEDDDDSDIGAFVEQLELKVNVGLPDIVDKLQFLHKVLSPILESYLITAYFITENLTCDMPEDDFMKKLRDFAQERARKKLLVYIESCGMVTLKTAVKAFQNLDILETYKEANLTMICLAEHLGVLSRLDQYIEILKVARY